ncbi:MAG: ABC transporter permease, partial [Desulfuromusa sp.]
MAEPLTKKRCKEIAIKTLQIIAMVAITFLGLLLITFLIGRVVPIDPVLAVVGDKASQEVYDRARLAMGLDLPLWKQFFIYLGSVLRGDFGTSVLTAKPVLEDILRVFPATMELAFFATLFGVFVGIPLGVISAVKRGGLLDHISRVVGLLGYSLPIFWLALLALIVFYAKLDWLPGPGRIDIFYDGIVSPVTGFLLVDSALAGEWGIFGNA